MLALIKLRYQQPWRDKHRPYKVHLSIPIFVFVVSLYFVVAPILEKPQIEYFYVSIYILTGLLTYLLFVRHQFQLKSMGAFTRTCQILLSVVPCDEDPFLD